MKPNDLNHQSVNVGLSPDREAIAGQTLRYRQRYRSTQPTINP